MENCQIPNHFYLSIFAYISAAEPIKHNFHYLGPPVLDQSVKTCNTDTCFLILKAICTAVKISTAVKINQAKWHSRKDVG
jgi:hypothetical protein